MVAIKIPKVTFQPPTFNSVEEERRHRKQRLAAAFRLFARFGFSEGIAGHITVRDPDTSTISGLILLECTLV